MQTNKLILLKADEKPVWMDMPKWMEARDGREQTKEAREKKKKTK